MMIDELEGAFREGDLDKIKKLISSSNNPRFWCDYSLVRAPEYKHMFTVHGFKCLVDLGANIHIDNNEPVIVASGNGALNIVKYFISLGANFRDKNDKAVWLASENGHLNIVKYLVSLGADFRAYDNYAVRMASKNGHLNIVQYLVNLGADFRANNNYAIRWAHINNHLNVTHYLLNLGAYHKNIVANFDLINKLYTSGHFNIVHKLILHNNPKISVDKMEQFKSIQKSVNKIIEARKWNLSLLTKSHFIDILVQISL